MATLTKQQIRITALEMALRNRPTLEYNHLQGKTMPTPYDVIGSAKKIEIYINTGK